MTNYLRIMQISDAVLSNLLQTITPSSSSTLLWKNILEIMGYLIARFNIKCRRVKAHLPSHRHRPNIKTNTYYGLLPGLELCPTESGTRSFFYIAWWEEAESEKYQRGGCWLRCWWARWEKVLGRRRRRFRTKWPWRRRSEQFTNAVSLSIAPPIHWRWCLIIRKLSPNNKKI